MILLGCIAKLERVVARGCTAALTRERRGELGHRVRDIDAMCCAARAVSARGALWVDAASLSRLRAQRVGRTTHISSSHGRLRFFRITQPKGRSVEVADTHTTDTVHTIVYIRPAG